MKPDGRVGSQGPRSGRPDRARKDAADEQGEVPPVVARGLRQSMSETKVVSPVFKEGDEVELVAGSYQGTLGVFVGFSEDPKWADIRERNGAVRRHPVQWLGHARASLSPIPPRERTAE